jgi:uncharacterized oxidoreductase
MDMTGNTVLITGGGSGIGRGLAEAFHRMGNQVIVAGRRQSALDETLAANPGMRSVVLDVASPEGIAEAAGRLTRDYPELNVVVHNAGIMQPEDVTKGDAAAAESIVATNLLGPIRLTAALMPQLLARRSATIVTVSSGLAFVPLAPTPTYCATKAAIHSYSMSLRYQLRETGVKVIEIAPPWVATELMGQVPDDPRAMPLDEFIEETMRLLPGAVDEVLVQRVKPLRDAVSEGREYEFFQQLNDAMREIH